MFKPGVIMLTMKDDQWKQRIPEQKNWFSMQMNMKSYNDLKCYLVPFGNYNV